MQQREYWACQFAEHEFYDYLDYRPTYITPYAVCYKKWASIIDIIRAMNVI